MFFAGEGATGREKPQGRKVTLAGPKTNIGRAEKSHKGHSVTSECYNSVHVTFDELWCHLGPMLRCCNFVIIATLITDIGHSCEYLPGDWTQTV